MATVKGAITQRDGNTYAIVTRSPAGIVTAEHLEKIAGIARKYRIPTIKITSGQRLALIGIGPGDVVKIRRELGDSAEQAEGPCVKYVQACLGIETCQYGVQDSIGLARVVEKKFRNRTLLRGESYPRHRPDGDQEGLDGPLWRERGDAATVWRCRGEKPG
jgi:NAD(P)H-nitrite reductase large subunit